MSGPYLCLACDHRTRARDASLCSRCWQADVQRRQAQIVRDCTAQGIVPPHFGPPGLLPAEVRDAANAAGRSAYAEAGERGAVRTERERASKRARSQAVLRWEAADMHRRRREKRADYVGLSGADPT